ncbi:PilZ domain-containing protein [Alteromonas sp. ASW11-19]|uniref:PilZ domain-containing protein n=1 Tax=Alteromonas salexigens TaxID=2982530 RepID=A0ABT2VR27_9ALTE|nr:PilZ domain-containing protein [Alteromonas salexigens]MCU7555754.1 PilZ domain-containing protein [Alteromonas salexigens]
MTDKRQFQRVPLQVAASLRHQHTSVPVMAEDVSLRGIRLSATEEDLAALPFDSHDPYEVSFKANQDSPAITMQLEQLYRQSDPHTPRTYMGCKVAHIPLDSVSALRRLIMLNSADNDISEQDLDALINAIYTSASSASDN